MTVTRYESSKNNNGMNYLTTLAFHGDSQAVDEFLSQGGELSDAVYGFAFGGHLTLLEALVGSDIRLLKEAAKGVARAKNYKQMTTKYLAQDFRESLAYGHGQANNESQIRAMLNAKEGSQYLSQVIEGLASTNQAPLLLELVQSTCFYSKALTAAAKSGHVGLVNNLLEKFSINISELDLLSVQSDPNLQLPLTYALKGYSQGRHFNEVASLLHLGLNIKQCLNELSQAETFDKSDKEALLSAIGEGELSTQVAHLIDTDYVLIETVYEVTPLSSLTLNMP